MNQEETVMFTTEQKDHYSQQALSYFKKAGIVLTPEEENHIEFADFGLGEFDQTGLILITYVNTTRVCAKELVLLPRQTCPEHRHPSIGRESGKEETFRCRFGLVYLYVSGIPTDNPHAAPPKGREAHYTARHEIVLHPGQQYTLQPDTLHWFQAGPNGAVVSEFSTTSRDDADIFTDGGIIR